MELALGLDVTLNVPSGVQPGGIQKVRGRRRFEYTIEEYRKYPKKIERDSYT